MILFCPVKVQHDDQIIQLPDQAMFRAPIDSRQIWKQFVQVEKQQMKEIKIQTSLVFVPDKCNISFETRKCIFYVNLRRKVIRIQPLPVLCQTACTSKGWPRANHTPHIKEYIVNQGPSMPMKGWLTKGQPSPHMKESPPLGVPVMIGYFPQLADGSIIGLTLAGEAPSWGEVAGKHKQHCTFLYVIFHLVSL